MESTAINSVFVVYRVDIENEKLHVIKIFYREDKAKEFTEIMNNLYGSLTKSFTMEEFPIW